MLIFGLMMFVKPHQFSEGIVSFSEQTWFHPFEILSRLTLGLLFLFLADTSPYSMLFNIIGGVLCFVAVLLLVMGAKRHKAFARKSATIGRNFRPIGVVAIVVSCGLIYLGLSYY